MKGKPGYSAMKEDGERERTEVREEDEQRGGRGEERTEGGEAKIRNGRDERCRENVEWTDR